MAEPLTNTGYKVTQFRDLTQSIKQKKDVFLPNYECDSCDFATLDLVRIQEHIAAEDHPWKLTHHIEAEQAAKQESN